MVTDSLWVQESLILFYIADDVSRWLSHTRHLWSLTFSIKQWVSRWTPGHGSISSQYRSRRMLFLSRGSYYRFSLKNFWINRPFHTCCKDSWGISRIHLNLALLKELVKPPASLSTLYSLAASWILSLLILLMDWKLCFIWSNC